MHSAPDANLLFKNYHQIQKLLNSHIPKKPPELSQNALANAHSSDPKPRNTILLEQLLPASNAAPAPSPHSTPLFTRIMLQLLPPPRRHITSHSSLPSGSRHHPPDLSSTPSLQTTIHTNNHTNYQTLVHSKTLTRRAIAPITPSSASHRQCR